MPETEGEEINKLVPVLSFLSYVFVCVYQCFFFVINVSVLKKNV